MSDFKNNPSKYMVHIGDVPLAVSRYGRIQNMVLSVDAYNLLLERLRIQRSDIFELRRILDIISPDLVETLNRVPRSPKVEELAPRWPMFKSLPRKSRKSWMTADLRAAIEEAKEETIWRAGNYLPVPEGSDAEYGRKAEAHVPWWVNEQEEISKRHAAEEESARIAREAMAARIAREAMAARIAGETAAAQIASEDEPLAQ